MIITIMIMPMKMLIIITIMIIMMRIIMTVIKILAKAIKKINETTIISYYHHSYD